MGIKIMFWLEICDESILVNRKALHVLEGELSLDSDNNLVFRGELECRIKKFGPSWCDKEYKFGTDETKVTR